MNQKEHLQNLLEQVRPSGFDPSFETHKENEDGEIKYDYWENYKGQEHVDERSVFPNEVVIDVDDADTEKRREETRKILTLLESQGLPFYVADTGGTGFHIHIFFQHTDVDWQDLRPWRKAVYRWLKHKAEKEANVDTELWDDEVVEFDAEMSKGHLVRAVGGRKIETGHRKTVVLPTSLEKKEVEELEDVDYPQQLDFWRINRVDNHEADLTWKEIQEAAEKLEKQEKERERKNLESSYKSSEDGLQAAREVPATEVLKLLGKDIEVGEQFLCPCHNDTNPSATVIETEDGVELMACFSNSCKEEMDVEKGRCAYFNALDILVESGEYRFKEAIEELSEEFDIEIELTEELSPGKINARDHAEERVKLRGRITAEKTGKGVPAEVWYCCRNCEESETVDGFSHIEELVFKGRKRMENVLKNIGNRVLNTDCPESGDHAISWNVNRYMNYAELWVEDLIEDVEEMRTGGTPSIRTVVLHDDIPSSRKVAIEGIVKVDPTNNDLVLIGSSIEALEGQAGNWESSEEILHHFTSHFQDTNPPSYLYQIAPGMAGRDLVRHSRLRLLHSPPEIPDIEGDKTIRGCIRECYIGDSKTYKSDSIEDTTEKHYEFGELASAETSTRAGLVYGITENNDAVKWGTIPLNNMGYVGIDGLNALHSKEIEQMREVLNKQKVKVNMAASGEAPAKVRISAAMNPENPMENYLFKCNALKDNYIFQKNPDITRWDIFIPFQDGDVEREKRINWEARERPIPDEVFKNHVYWAWSREPGDIVYAEETTDKIKEKASHLEEEYKIAELPVVHNGIREVVTRLSVAEACLRHSTDEEHEKVIVKPEHVENAVEFYEKTLEELEIKEYKQDLEGDMDVKNQFLEINKELGEKHYDVLSAVKHEPKSAAEISEELDVSEKTVKNKYDALKEYGLIETSQGKGTGLSSKGVRFLKNLMGRGDSSSETTGEAGKPNFTTLVDDALIELDATESGDPVGYQDVVEKVREIADGPAPENHIEAAIDGKLREGSLQEPVAGKIKLLGEPVKAEVSSS